LDSKIDIRKFSLKELTKEFTSLNEKSFRAKQVYYWLWKKGVTDFEAMTNISKNLREKLISRYTINNVKIANSWTSHDLTIKNTFILYDKLIVEGVLIPTKKRITACISVQAGCSLSCDFCATGKLKNERNLSSDEIFDQVVLLNNQALEKYGKTLSNVVYMGMGEPLLNYKNVVNSIDKLTSENGLGMSPKRITVSTAGISKMIKKLADDDIRFNLALSLHAASDHKRNKIMPINESNSLDSLTKALVYFVKKTKIRPTFEYIIFKDFNDNIQDAKELATFCRSFPCKINIIEYNSTDGAKYLQADKDKVNEFAAFLESRNIIVNIRRSRGKDIDAACGQLANKNVDMSKLN